MLLCARHATSVQAIRMTRQELSFSHCNGCQTRPTGTARAGSRRGCARAESNNEIGQFRGPIQWEEVAAIADGLHHDTGDQPASSLTLCDWRPVLLAIYEEGGSFDPRVKVPRF